jgi:hypothetical protein
MTRSLAVPSPTSVVAAMIESPDLVRTIRSMPAPQFSALVRQVGVEDAGELIAFATRDQIVTAFDEDLFDNPAPGEREVFDPQRFVVWLEVLLEAGDAVAASKLAELSEEFLAHAFQNLVWVLDVDALALRMSRGGRAADAVDRALESSLSEELDGYLLVAKQHDGWDATLALVLALDRDHRDLLVRILDHCAAIAGDYVEDLDALADVLTLEESLADDVEAEREQRRAQQGYVEPRAARNFLTLARKPLKRSDKRDPVTRAYFRELEIDASATEDRAAALERLGAAAGETISSGSEMELAPASSSDPLDAFIAAMQLVHEHDPARFGARMEELAYLSNVLVAGAAIDGERVGAVRAAEAALATVALGAALELQEAATASALARVLMAFSADYLFRKASSTLVRADRGHLGFLCSRDELRELVDAESEPD